MNAKNKFKKVIIKNEEYIEFITGGKNSIPVLVDIEPWEKYLYKYHWTAIKKEKYYTVKTSINKHSVRIHRMIIEKEFDEVDYWGNTIDHINNNTLDNRLINLRIYNAKLNSTNIKSKYLKDDLHLIYPQVHKKNGVNVIYGYKVHTNIFDETIYKSFRTIEEAKIYRNLEILPYIQKRIDEMIKKTRDIEFERGLKNKILNNELGEIVSILNKYGINTVELER